TRLASTGQDGMVRVWDVGPAAGERQDRPVQSLAGHTGGVFGVALSADGAKLASAGADGTVRVWELAGSEARALQVLRGHEREVICVAFHPDGRRIASGGADRRVRTWDIATGLEQPDPLATAARIDALSFSPDG